MDASRRLRIGPIRSPSPLMAFGAARRLRLLGRTGMMERGSEHSGAEPRPFRSAGHPRRTDAATPHVLPGDRSMSPLGSFRRIAIAGAACALLVSAATLE